ncbi:MAG TPA: GntR family transcriptional regulator [Pirellulales bacterium]|nr:GntR family transcriptional regulator [Pirellulales bacterium]
MATASGPKIVAVAETILGDIRRRKLRPGDAYLDTAATARLLRVSGSTVNRALQLLAQRGVLQRRQRQGTIVLDAGPRPPEAALRRVHLLVREDHLRTEGLWADGVLLGLQGALPGTELQFNFRPEVNEAEYVQHLIHDILGSRQATGLVLVRSTVASQRLVEASGLPAVVSGSLQPSIRELPSLDRDQRQIGRLLAEHLLRANCRRVIVFMRDRLTPGDHTMLDSALSALAAADVPLDAITLRCLPTDREAITAAAGDLLADARGRVGCLCRSEMLARGVDAASKTLKLGGRRQPVLVVADSWRERASEVSYPSIETSIAAEQWGAVLGRMLATAARGERPDPYRQLIPVRLRTGADAHGK